MNSACACMGPQRGDPYCYCEMLNKGFTPTPWSAEEEAGFKLALAKMFGWKDDKHVTKCEPENN